MSLRSRLTPRALREITAVVAWWRTERPAAPDLVIDEIEAALALLADAPHLGSTYPGPRAGTRRFLLTQTRFHVYYCVRGDELVVLSLWSAIRGRGPRV